MNPDQVVPLDLARNLLLFMDPPPHTKYRKVMQTAFVPRTVNRMEDEIRARVTRVIDAIAAAGRADFVQDVAVPVPLGVLAQMMGLPDGDIERMRRWTDDIERSQLDEEGGTALPVFTEMGGYLQEQIAAQAERGGDSLVMRLKKGEVDGRPLDDNEILVFFALLVFAGNDTTRNTASSGLLALLRPPRSVGAAVHASRSGSRTPSRRSCAGPRWSTTSAARRPGTPTLGGQQIAAGERVMIWYASASRDGPAAPDPGRFDVTRQSVDHNAFGGGGRHFCLGAGLARLELRILFEELTRRLPSLELAGEPRAPVLGLGELADQAAGQVRAKLGSVHNQSEGGPMAIEGSASIEIEAPIEQVFEVAADVENSPRWQPDIKKAQVKERDEEGRQVLVRTETDAKVRTLGSDLRFTYHPPTTLSWRQEKGDLKSVEGSWTLEDLGGQRTRATYWMEVDLGRMLGAVIRGPLAGELRKQLVESMPEKLKRDVEGA